MRAAGRLAGELPGWGSGILSILTVYSTMPRAHHAQGGNADSIANPSRDTSQVLTNRNRSATFAHHEGPLLPTLPQFEREENTQERAARTGGLQANRNAALSLLRLRFAIPGPQTGFDDFTRGASSSRCPRVSMTCFGMTST